jgi:tetratricopeptide (TPR) repeat protein
VNGFIYLFCGQANLELGYLIIAENVLKRCFQYPEDTALQLQAHNLLGKCYREQGHFDKACQCYEQVIRNDEADTGLIHTVSFDLGQIYAQQQVYDKALIYFGMAIEYASSDVLSIQETKLAEYYMHRSSVFEALGMLEHSKLDLQKILDADPTFVQRYHQMAVKYEETDMLLEAA